MKKILFIFCIIWMAMIFWFSAQPGEVSSTQSNSALHYLKIIDNKYNIRENKYINKGIKFFRDDLGLMKQYNKEYILRKVAHFSLYFGLSSILMLFGYAFTKSITLSGIFGFITSVIYAYYDEMHQLDVLGRAGSLKDVGIDSLGAFFGIVFIGAILIAIIEFLSLIKKYKYKKA